MPKQGDIILVPIPFTDLSTHKQRPVIVISNDDYHQRTTDMIVVAMTSNPTPVFYGFVITSANLQKGNLKRPSMVRTDKIYTLSQSLARQRFGKVKEEVLQQIRTQLSVLVGKNTPTT